MSVVCSSSLMIASLLYQEPMFLCLLFHIIIIILTTILLLSFSVSLSCFIFTFIFTQSCVIYSYFPGSYSAYYSRRNQCEKFKNHNLLIMLKLILFISNYFTAPFFLCILFFMTIIKTQRSNCWKLKFTKLQYLLF